MTCTDSEINLKSLRMKKKTTIIYQGVIFQKLKYSYQSQICLKKLRNRNIHVAEKIDQLQVISTILACHNTEIGLTYHELK